MKSFTEDQTPFVIAIYGFDASNARATVEKSNVPLITTNTSATIRFKRNGSTIASASFPVRAIGTSFYFSNPAVVTAWVNSNGVQADEYDAAFDLDSFEKISGTNLVVLEWVYEGQVQVGNSWSGYDSGTGGCINCQIN